MKRIVILLILPFIISCTGNYLKPDYDKDKKIVDIAGYKINEVSRFNKKNKPSITQEYITESIYRIDTKDNNCKQLNINITNIDGNWYSYKSATDMILEGSGNICTLDETIKNLDFISCINSQYYITNSETKYMGYGYSEILRTNKQCYNSIKNHIKNKK